MAKECNERNAGTEKPDDMTFDEADAARKPRVIRRPETPTKQEIADHLPLHLPYRSWCPDCVAGRGVSSPHVMSKDEPLGVTISIDYCFMSQQDEGSDTYPVLIVFDNALKAIWALPVQNKGAVPYVIKWLVGVLDTAGYRGEKISMKSDQEPAILGLKKAVAAARMGETFLIDSPVRESKANGAVERAVRSWQGQVRTIKHYFERCTSKKLDIEHPLFQWLEMWSADIINKFRLREDGRTAYEVMSGHRCRHQVIAFGEAVQFKFTTDKNKRHKAEVEWNDGVFVGVECKSGEYLVINAEGLFKCNRVMKRPIENAFDPNCIEYATVGIDEYVSAGARTAPDTRVRVPNEVP